MGTSACTRGQELAARFALRSPSLVAGALALFAAASSAETGFDVRVERLEITGEAPYVDEFDDGLRQAGPTGHLVDRWATEVSEQEGALRLTDDDGSDGMPSFDLVVLDRPVRRALEEAAVQVTIRPGGPPAWRGIAVIPKTPDGRASLTGLVLVAGRGPVTAIGVPAPQGLGPPLGSLARPRAGGNAVFGRRDTFILATPPAGAYPVCGAAGEEVVVLSDGVTTACDELPASAAGAALRLRVEAVAGSAHLRVGYRVGEEGMLVDGSAWRIPTPAQGARIPDGELFPGLLAAAARREGAHWVDYAGVVTPGGILRGGGEIVRIEGVLSRQRFPSAPTSPWSPGDGIFSLDFATGEGAPAAAVLETGRGRLRAIAEATPERVVCEAGARQGKLCRCGRMAVGRRAGVSLEGPEATLGGGFRELLASSFDHQTHLSYIVARR